MGSHFNLHQCSANLVDATAAILHQCTQHTVAKVVKEERNHSLTLMRDRKESGLSQRPIVPGGGRWLQPWCRFGGGGAARCANIHANISDSSGGQLDVHARTSDSSREARPTEGTQRDRHTPQRKTHPQDTPGIQSNLWPLGFRDMEI